MSGEAVPLETPEKRPALSCESVARDDLQLALPPCRDRIVLDKVGEQTYQLTDLVGLQRATLHGHLMLEWDSLGFCAVAGQDQSGNEFVKLPEEVFKRHLRENDLGEMFLVDEGQARGSRAVSLYGFRARYKDASIVVRTGPTSASVELAAYVFSAPRACSQRVYWGLFDVYRALGLTTFGRQPCKWVNAGMPKWVGLLALTMPGSHFVLSKHWNLSKTKLTTMPWHDRCLPQPAVSSIGLLAMLLQFGHVAPGRGGLKCEAGRFAAVEIFRGLLRVALKTPMAVRVILSSKWVCRWPRPSVLFDSGETVVNIQVAAGGDVDLSPMLECVDDSGAEVERRRWATALVKQGCDLATPASMTTLLELCAGLKVLHSFLMQVMWEVAQQLERGLAKVNGGGSGADEHVSFTFGTWAPAPGDGNMEEKLYQYTVACCGEASRHKVFTLACDKATPCHMSVMNGVLSCPDNVCMLLCPQVETGFSSEHIDAETKARLDRKRSIVDEEVGTFPAQAKRQRAWLCRDREDIAAGSWRPIQVHRTSAKKFCLSVDNMLRISTGLDGLSAFRYDESAPQWASWPEWPGLGLAIDMGSDGLSAFYALVAKDLNIWLWPDPSHSCTRSFQSVLRQLHLHEFFLLMLVSWNLEHGPHSDQGRRGQLRAALGELYDRSSPSECPLFQHLASGMVADLEGADIVHFPREAAIEDELWQWLKERCRASPLGRRTSTNRFGGLQHAAIKNRAWWHVHLFERTYLALESDFFKGKKFQARLTVKSQKTETISEGLGVTDSKRLSVEDRSLRACCENAVVISVLSLDDIHHRRVIDAVVEAQKPLDKFHTTQNRVLRDTVSTEEWLVEQICGGFRAHLAEFLSLLVDASALVDCGFIIPSLAGKSGGQPGEPDLNAQVIGEDEHADLFGQLCCSFVAQRALRGLYYMSWPVRTIGALKGAQQATTILADFSEDKALWEKFEAMPGKGSDEKLISKRSVFRMRCVKQVAAAIEQDGPVLTEALAGVLRAHARACIQTQIVEDCNGMQKNHAFQAVGRRFRRPSTCMAVCLQRDIISSRHRFRNVEVNTAARSFDAKLPHNAFQAEKDKLSMSFDFVAGTNQSPEWWSPGPATIACPHSDLALLKQASELGDLHRVQCAWLGQVCKLEHKLALGVRHGDAWRWFVALHHFPKSAALLWEVDLEVVPDSAYTWLRFHPSGDAMTLQAVLDMTGEQLKALTFEWRSPLWQQNVLPAAYTASLQVGVRAFVSGHGIRTLGEIACLHAWWTLPRSTVCDFARHLGVYIEPGADLLQVLWVVAQAQLTCSDEELLAIVHQRVVAGDENVGYSQALLELDEAIDMIDPVDVEQVHQAKKSAAISLENRRAFKEVFVQKARAVRAAVAGQPRKKRKGDGKAAAPKRVCIPHHCTQQDAKTLLPPDTSVWRSLQRAEWCGHCQGHRRVTESFLKNGGSEGALRACLVRLWTQHLDRYGMPHSDCWVEGLFAPAGGAASSSSNA